MEIPPNGLLIWFLALLLLVVLESRLDSILSQHRAMKLHWWQAQLFSDHVVFDRSSVTDVFSLNHFGGQRGRGDSRSASKSLKFRVDNFAIFIYLKKNELGLVYYSQNICTVP